MEMPSFWLMRSEFCRRPLRIVPPMAPALLAASIASLLYPLLSATQMAV